MWQGGDNTVDKSADNTQITPASCSPLQRHTLIPHLKHCCSWLIMLTMTFYRHTYSVVFLFSYKALCLLCIYSIFAWFRTSGVTYFSSNSYWPVSVVYFLAFLFWAGVFLNKRWLGSNIYCNARAGITRVLMKDTQHNWTASHPPHSVTQCYTDLTQLPTLLHTQLCLQ